MMLIFLDIDGVLIPDRKFETSAIETGRLKFDPKCLQAFEDVLRHHSEALVVISSSWREVFSFEVVRPLFSPDIAERAIGFTPFLNPKLTHQYQYLRYQEVLEFLRQNNALETPWVAIDDIPEHYPPHIPVVVTDADTGFDAMTAMLLTLYLQTL